MVYGGKRDWAHARLENLRMANLKNVLNALSGLYVLENYFVKYIGMIKVDGLEPTAEMKKLIAQEKCGEISMEDERKALDRKYKMKK